MITRLSDPLNGPEIWRRFLEEWEPVNRGNEHADAIAAMSSHGNQRLEEWERLVRQYEAQNVDTLRDTIKAATLAHNPHDSEWCRCVRLSATRLQEYDALKSMWKEKGKSKRKGKAQAKAKAKAKAKERKKQG